LIAFTPNFFILGAAKCGTTTLHWYLKNHEDICLSVPKEPFFFEAYFEEGLAFYQNNYFSHWKGEKIIGESRHRNLYLPYVPQRIHTVNPNAKLLVLLRNPTERAYSHWYHNFARKSEELDFKQAIAQDFDRIQRGLDCSTASEIAAHVRKLPRAAPYKEIGLGLYRTYIDSGYYINQIERYLDLFPSSQLKVLFFEDLINNPEQLISEVFAFLEIDGQDFKLKTKNHNDHSKLPLGLTPYALLLKNIVPNLGNLFRIRYLKRTSSYDFFKEENNETLDWLRDHYKPYNVALQDFLKRDLEQWNH
jgi:hypothetical protein